MSKHSPGRAFWIGLVLAMTQTGVGQTVAAIPKLDLDRYMGTWYEVARLPTKAEKRCVSDALVLYALADKRNRFQVVTSCRLKDGNMEARNAGAKMDKSGDGRVNVSYLWPFSTKEWIFAAGPAYEWVLVGSPNHKFLWLLSKTPALPPEVVADLRSRAAAQGFEITKLVMVPQGAANPLAALSH